VVWAKQAVENRIVKGAISSSFRSVAGIGLGPP